MKKLLRKYKTYEVVLMNILAVLFSIIGLCLIILGIIMLLEAIREM